MHRSTIYRTSNCFTAATNYARISSVVSFYSHADRYIEDTDRFNRLISKGRKDAALGSLQKLRGKNVSQEQIKWEIEALSNYSSNEGKGNWKEVFNKDNRVSWLKM